MSTLPPSWRDLSSVPVPEGTFLPGTSIEIIRPVNASGARAVLFDFDGTLSLIRSGWVEVMVPMMVEILEQTGTGESRRSLENTVREFVARLTGKQTIYQMIELARQVEMRGAEPLQPIEYKRMYLDRLWRLIGDRVKALQTGRADPDQYLVPGARRLLETLRGRNLAIYIASGTDQADVLREAELLRLTEYAEGRVYGALDDPSRYSKRMVIQRIIAEHRIRPGELLGFGDGYVEIEDVKAAGGCAVAVATEEPECRSVDQWKRRRLILAGSDIVIPNYLEQDKLLEYLFREETPHGADTKLKE